MRCADIPHSLSCFCLSSQPSVLLMSLDPLERPMISVDDPQALPIVPSIASEQQPKPGSFRVLLWRRSQKQDGDRYQSPKARTPSDLIRWGFSCSWISRSSFSDPYKERQTSDNESEDRRHDDPCEGNHHAQRGDFRITVARILSHAGNKSGPGFSPAGTLIGLAQVNPGIDPSIAAGASYVTLIHLSM